MHAPRRLRRSARAAQTCGSRCPSTDPTLRSTPQYSRGAWRCAAAAPSTSTSTRASFQPWYNCTPFRHPPFRHTHMGAHLCQPHHSNTRRTLRSWPTQAHLRGLPTTNGAMFRGKKRFFHIALQGRWVPGALAAGGSWVGRGGAAPCGARHAAGCSSPPPHTHTRRCFAGSSGRWMRGACAWGRSF